jgi:hypothetical protein
VAKIRGGDASLGYMPGIGRKESHDKRRSSGAVDPARFLLRWEMS